MKTKKFIILFFICIAGFISGKYLQSIYGLDPPYSYFWAGFALELISVFVAIIILILYLVSYLRKLKKSN